MRHKSLLVLAVTCMGLLSACTKAVIGPDLAQRPTPFVIEGTIELSDTFGVMQATVTALPGGDTAVVQFENLGASRKPSKPTSPTIAPILLRWTKLLPRRTRGYSCQVMLLWPGLKS